MREKQKLTTPKGVIKETLIATIQDDPNAAISSINYGRPLKVRGALKATRHDETPKQNLLSPYCVLGECSKIHTLTSIKNMIN
jgi:hypothetical protein